MLNLIFFFVRFFLNYFGSVEDFSVCEICVFGGDAYVDLMEFLL